MRLRPIQTDGASASAQALAEGKADLAIIRGDLEVPKNAQAVATLRKNVAVLWVPPAAKVKGKKAGPKITKIAQLAGHRIGVVGRTQANVNLLKVILQQYGVDPAKVEIVQFPANEAAEAINNQKADAYLAAGPVNSKITTDAIAASTRDGGTPTFLAIDSAEAIAQNHPAYEAAEIPAGSFGGSPAGRRTRSRPSASRTTSWRAEALSETTVAAFTRQLFAVRQSLKNEFPLAAKIETPDTDKDADDSRASRRGGLRRRRGKDLPRSLQRLHLVGADGAVGDGLGRRLVCGLSEEGRAQQQHLAARAAAGHARRRTQQRFDRRARPACRPRPTTSCATRCAASSTARSRKGALTAFNIALEQFHNAVADRKSLLMSMPQNLQRAGAQFRATGTA